MIYNKRNLSTQIEHLLKGPRYTAWNLPNNNYTPDIVEHWLRYHYPYLEYVARTDEDIHCIKLDLDSAIKQLPPQKRYLVTLLINGYRIQDIERGGITEVTGFSRKKVQKLLKKSYRMISVILEGKH